MAPKPAVLQKLRQAKAAAEKARQKALQEGRAPAPAKEEEDLEKLEQQLEERDEGDEDEDDEG
jgi:translation initiation factor IF-3